MSRDPMAAEAEAMRARYQRRAQLPADRYSPFRADALMAMQERERAVIRCLADAGMTNVGERTLIEIGCGAGGGLMQFLKLGFNPEHLAGSELIDARLENARRLLPRDVRLYGGDACRLDLGGEQFDIVYQATVFSSILDDQVQTVLARCMWDLAKPGGGILWYDFTFNNPRNPDVRGVPVNRLRALFPQGHLRTWRITLAPPLARLVSPIHPSLYSLFNAIPWLRTHVLCWIGKP